MKVEFALSIIEQLCDNGTPMEVQALKTIYAYINESQKTATNNAMVKCQFCNHTSFRCPKCFIINGGPNHGTVNGTSPVA